MQTLLVTIGLIFGLMLAGIGVECLYRRFAAKNPQLGPFRKEGGSCGSCSGGSGCSSSAGCTPR